MSSIRYGWIKAKKLKNNSLAVLSKQVIFKNILRSKHLIKVASTIFFTIMFVFLVLQMPGKSFASNIPDLFKIQTYGTTATLYFSPQSGINSGYYISYGFHTKAEDYGVYVNDSNISGAISY